MRIIAHEMPDGTVIRSSNFEHTLAWLMAGRGPDDLAAFIAAQISLGASVGEAQRMVVQIQDVEREIKNRSQGRGERATLLARRWAYALRDGGMSEADAIALIAENAVPDAVRHVEVTNIVTQENAEYRTDPTGKSTLRLSGNTLTWHMPGVREKDRELRRRARVPKLAALDVEFMRALEKNDKTAAAAVATKKQVLRDVTADPAIEAALTPEALMAAWPAILL